MQRRRRLVFPFSAIVGMEKLKLAMLINAIDPKIGGLLIRGPKGSGKTTIVRALADILPKIKVVKGCPFNCHPEDLSNMCSKCSERYRQTGRLPMEEKEMVVVDLPLGATEDRVVGSLDVEKAIKHGIEALEPGILADANQNILYVDEINLLPDHIADDLLDAAATGWNVVEREGISVSHPARFIFIGTMNPEEGELRPQLLDRFPLSVTVRRMASVKDRMEVVKRNMEFEDNPEGFYEKYRPMQEELKNRIIQARKVLPKVRINEGLIQAVCESCLELKVDGLRPDIVITRAARAIAALNNRTEVTTDDILAAAELALSHRTREGGFLEPATPDEIVKTFWAKVKEVLKVQAKKYGKEKDLDKTKSLGKGKSMVFITGKATRKEEEKSKKGMAKFRERIFRLAYRLDRLLRLPTIVFGKKARRVRKDATTIEGSVVKSRVPLEAQFTKKEKLEKGKVKGHPFWTGKLGAPQPSMGISLFNRVKDGLLTPFKGFKGSFKPKKIKSRRLAVHAGKRAEAFTTLNRGKPYGWRFPRGKPRDVHLPATIRAAARKQKNREKPARIALQITLKDIREKMRLYKAPLTLVFVVDLSGSMLFKIEPVKEALLRLHRDAYRYRDRIGIVALKDTGAVVVQHPTRNLALVANRLINLRISGFTPLAAGMLKAWEVLKEAKRRDPSTIPVMAIITDGNANVPLRRSLETGEIRRIEEAEIIVRKYEDVAVHDVFSVAKMISREGINTIVVNTNPHMLGKETYGKLVTEALAKMTGGSHHFVGRAFTPEELIENVTERIAEDQRRIAYESSRIPASKHWIQPD